MVDYHKHLINNDIFMDILFSVNMFWYLVAFGIFIYLIYDSYKEGGIKEAIKFVIIFGGAFLLIRTFLVQPFLVEGPSMLPNFASGNYLLVDKFSYKFLTRPARGETVVFDVPDSKHAFRVCHFRFWGTCYFQSNRYLIKRIIALPGEKVVIKNGVVTIYNLENPNGLILEEKHIEYNVAFSDERTLGENEYYVLGDNRANSHDSRHWGPLPSNKIVGRPILRLTPLSMIGLWPGSL